MGRAGKRICQIPGPHQRLNPQGAQTRNPRRITAGSNDGPSHGDKPGGKGAGGVAVAKGQKRVHRLSIMALQGRDKA